MKDIRFLIIALSIGIFAVLLSPVSVRAVGGAPSDNSTMPNFPTGDQSLNEIKPPVKYISQGPSSQSKTTPPNVIAGLVGASGQYKSKVTSNETWYLDIDINTSGWLYIYEFFPDKGNSLGQWITYKWEMLQGGVWRFGPFSPENNVVEGQHIYRIWFYSDGKWVGESTDSNQQILIYWTYAKGQPAESTPAITPPTVKETTFIDSLRSFITQPTGLVLSLLLLAVIIVLIIFIYRKKYAVWSNSQSTVLLSNEKEKETEDISREMPLTVAKATISLPNGIDIHLTGSSRIFGRGDLARVLGLDELGLISRQQFQVNFKDDQFYIEDLGSANGTKLNGTDISSKGPVIISNNDIIEPSDSIYLKFHTQKPSQD